MVIQAFRKLDWLLYSILIKLKVWTKSWFNLLPLQITLTCCHHIMLHHRFANATQALLCKSTCRKLENMKKGFKPHTPHIPRYPRALSCKKHCKVQLNTTITCGFKVSTAALISPRLSSSNFKPNPQEISNFFVFKIKVIRAWFAGTMNQSLLRAWRSC